MMAQGINPAVSRALPMHNSVLDLGRVLAGNRLETVL